MSSNYQLVKTSEKDLTQHFFKFYNHVRNEWKKLISILKENKTISDENYKMFKRMENKSNHMEADILDESIWSISRNQPVANHLRFVISIIYSISDLERMADYVINCVNIIRQNKFTNYAIAIALDAFKLSFNLARKNNSDIIILNDPDGDRLGVSVKDGEGYLVLTGLEISSLLLDFIIKQSKDKNKICLIKSVVSGGVCDKISEF